MIIRYDYRKTGNINITSNFKLKELLNDSGSPYVDVDIQFMNKVQKLRDKIGPIRVTSYFRNYDYNKSIGGSNYSAHCMGQAIDFLIDGRNVEEIIIEALKLGFKGIGVADTYIHLDTYRDKITFWEYDKNNKSYSTDKYNYLIDRVFNHKINFKVPNNLKLEFLDNGLYKFKAWGTNCYITENMIGDKIQIIKGKEPAEKKSSVYDRTKADVIINGGFFATVNGNTVSPYKADKVYETLAGYPDFVYQGWCFAVKDNIPELVRLKKITEFDKYDYAIEIAPTLVIENNHIVEGMNNSFNNAKTDRTAIAWNDTHIYTIVVDSMTIYELSALLIDLGMKYAVNLDGGGSSQLMYKGRSIKSGRAVDNFITIN